VKLKGFLKIPRSGRTIQLVINIPEPSVPKTIAVTPHPPKATRRARAWDVLRFAGPSAVSVAAIVISILSLLGQQAANRDMQEANAAAQHANAETAAASQRQNAAQVSFLQTALSQSPFTSMLVENHATTPIYQVTVQALATVFAKFTGGPKGIKGYLAALAGGNSYLTENFTFFIGDIPACSSGTVTDLVTAATSAMLDTKKLAPIVIGANPVAVDVMSMSFKDSSGTAWQYSDLGGLRKLADVPETTNFPSAYLGTRYKDANSCT
jgi:hypothetical protein